MAIGTVTVLPSVTYCTVSSTSVTPGGGRYSRTFVAADPAPWVTLATLPSMALSLPIAWDVRAMTALSPARTTIRSWATARVVGPAAIDARIVRDSHIVFIGRDPPKRTIDWVGQVSLGLEPDSVRRSTRSQAPIAVRPPARLEMYRAPGGLGTDPTPPDAGR